MTDTGQVHTQDSQRMALNYISQGLLKAKPTGSVLHTFIQAGTSEHPDTYTLIRTSHLLVVRHTLRSWATKPIY